MQPLLGFMVQRYVIHTDPTHLGSAAAMSCSSSELADTLSVAYIARSTSGAELTPVSMIDWIISRSRSLRANAHATSEA